MTETAPAWSRRVAPGAWALALLVAPAVGCFALGRVFLHREGLRPGFGDLTQVVIGALAAAALLALGGAVRAVRYLTGRASRPAELPARWLLYAAMVSVAAHLWLMPGGHPVFLAASTLLAAGLPGALARVGPAGATGRATRVADVVLGNVALAVVLLEIGLRVLGRVAPSPLFVDPHSPAETVELRRLPAGTYHFGVPISGAGYYDDEVAPIPGPGGRVVSIGDSFSLGMVPLRDHYTSVCEALVGAEVVNMGMPAIGPAEYVHLAETEARSLRPDVVVVALFVGNDLHEWCVGGYRGLPFGRARLRLYTVPPRLLALARARAARERGAVSFKTFGPGTAVDARRLRRELPWLEAPGTEPPSFTVPAYLEIERKRALALTSGTPRCWAEARAALGRLPAATAGSRLLVMLIPDELQVEDPLYEQVVARLPGTHDARDAPQRLLMEELRRLDIPALDLLPVMRAVPPGPDGWRHLYHLRDTHWNVKGNRVAGEAMAKALEPLLEGRAARPTGAR